jgi:uncharacterized protein (DUF302 family)
MSDNGLITVRCERSVRETVDRLAEVVAAAGLTVFGRVDHGGNATAVGMQLRPTELLIFGNPRGGTPLMQDQQTAGIDLPLKALVWEDADGAVWLTCNDAEWVAQRHGLGAHSQNAVEAMAKGQAAVVAKAAAADPAS